MTKPQKISTCIWFDTAAEDAARLYCSIFEGSRITGIARYGPGAPMPEGSVLTVTFELAGVEYTGLNGGPQFPLSEAVSLVVACDTQAEIDRVWAALLADGGREVHCGWLKDRYGLSWQVIPSRLREMLSHPDPAVASRVMAAIVSMHKLDVARLEAAFEGR